MTAFERLLAALETAGQRTTGNGRQRMAQCPAHDDGHASLSVTQGNDRVLVKCQAGCDTDEVLAALDLTRTDLFDTPRQNGNGARRHIVATYDYTDETGTLLYQGVRFEPKGFQQRRPDGNGGWIYKLEDTRRVLYHLPQVLSAAQAHQTVYVVEGEKDVHAVEKAGAVATCNVGGAGSWKPSYTEALIGAEVVIIPDLDTPGRAHAAQVAAALRAAGISTRLFEPASGKDVSDHITAGFTLADLAPEGTSTLAGPAEEPEDESLSTGKRLVDGAAFILDATLDVPAIWGDGEQVLWPDLEALYITGGPGVGKTTIAQQVVLASIGIGHPHFLGLPVARQDKILYLAMDRPRQIAKSFARMVNENDRTVLTERLVIWKGPPPQDIAKNTLSLLTLATLAGATTIVLDSLKDAALGLSSDEVGAAVNRAIQTCLVEGINVIVLHHQTKRSGDGGGGKPLTLADMYGSAWLGAGAGSVVLIHGEAGDTVVELRHLKHPAEQVGPFKVEHDHIAGTSRLSDDQVDPLKWLRKQRTPVTAHHLAQLYADPGSPAKPKHVERARRDLNRLTRQGFAIKTDGTKGGTSGGLPDTWLPAARPHQSQLTDTHSRAITDPITAPSKAITEPITAPFSREPPRTPDSDHDPTTLTHKQAITEPITPITGGPITTPPTYVVGGEGVETVDPAPEPSTWEPTTLGQRGKPAS